MADKHVVSGGPDGKKWGVRTPGKSRVGSRHATQQQAIERGRESAAASGGGELNVHGKDGRIRQKNTIPPAKDPFPPKG